MVDYKSFGVVFDQYLFDLFLQEIKKPAQNKVKQLQAFGIHMYPELHRIPVSQQVVLHDKYTDAYFNASAISSDAYLTKEPKMLGYEKQRWANRPNVANHIIAIKEKEIANKYDTADMCASLMLADLSKDNVELGYMPSRIWQIVENAPEAFFLSGMCKRDYPSPVNLQQKTFTVIADLLMEDWHFWIGAFCNAFDRNEDRFLSEVCKMSSKFGYQKLADKIQGQYRNTIAC